MTFRRSLLFLLLSFGLIGIIGIACSDDSPSEPDRDETPPPPPTSLTVTQEQLGLRLDWDIPLIDGEPVPDLRGYNVYREPGFTSPGKVNPDSGKAATPELDDFIFVLESNYFDRSVTEGKSYVYTVTAVDDSSNESESIQSDAVVFDTRGPLVTITSPVSGTVTNVPTIGVSGSVVDSQTVSSATIYVNGSAAAQPAVDASGNYSTQVALQIGQNLLKAEAADPNGNIGTSSEVSVSYDTSSVVVVITSPENGSITRNPRVEVSGTVSDPSIETGTLILNGAESEIDISGGQFDISVDLEEGVNTIRVRAANNAGTSGTSSTVRITRDSVNPTVYILQPIDQTPFQESPILVSGTVTDENPPDSVTVTVGATVRKLVLVGGQYQVYVELSEGSNQITVTAVDLAGNVGTNSVTVYLNSYGPTVRITTPQDGALLNDPEVDVGGTVTDPNIATGNLFVDGVPRAISIDSGIFLEAVTLSGDGSHMFWMEVVDEYERPGVSDTITVTLDTTPPDVVITTPADGSVGNTQIISLAGQVSDTSIEGATVVLNGFATNITVQNGSFSTQITLVEGANSVYVRATDSAGNTGYSDTLTVTLDTQAQIFEVDHDAHGEVLELGDHVLLWLDAGETGGEASIDIGDVIMDIELYDDGTNGDEEAGDGVYTYDYTVQVGDEVYQAQVVGHFTDHVGNVALDLAADETITINTPPVGVLLFIPGYTEVTSAAVYLKWLPATVPDFQDYRLYRSSFPGVDTTSTLLTTITTVGQDTVFYTDRDPSFDGGETYYYKVYVRDQLGATAESREVSATIDNWPSDQQSSIPTGDFPCYMEKLQTGTGTFVFLTHLSTPGRIQVMNFASDGVVATFGPDDGVTTWTVGVSTNPYAEALVAGWDADDVQSKVYRISAYGDIELNQTVNMNGQVWGVDSGWGWNDTLYAFAPAGDSIAVINLSNGTLVHEFPDQLNGRYDDAIASPDRRLIYVSSSSGIVSTIDTYDWAFTQTHDYGISIQRMDVSSDYIFLSQADAARVTVVNRYNMQFERELVVPSPPKYAHLLPGGRYLYVSCYDANVVAVIDTQTWQLVDHISVFAPIGILSNDQGNKVYVASLYWAGGLNVLKF